MHKNWEGCFTSLLNPKYFPCLCGYITTLTDKFEREIHVINRDKTSKVFICSCYMIGCKSTPLLFYLKQLIPIANSHDGALLVSLWPPWVTPLLAVEEGCVCWGHGAGFTRLWLVECNTDEDFIQSAVFMMGEQREWTLSSQDLSTPLCYLFALLSFFSFNFLSFYNLPMYPHRYKIKPLYEKVFPLVRGKILMKTHTVACMHECKHANMRT